MPISPISQHPFPVCIYLHGCLKATDAPDQAQKQATWHPNPQKTSLHDAPNDPEASEASTDKRPPPAKWGRAPSPRQARDPQQPRRPLFPYGPSGGWVGGPRVLERRGRRGQSPRGRGEGRGRGGAPRQGTGAQSAPGQQTRGGDRATAEGSPRAALRADHVERT